MLWILRDGICSTQQKKRKISYIAELFNDNDEVFVATTDYLKALPDSIAKWLPKPLASLGTDGFGRSASRAALRDFFEVDAKHIAFAALGELAKEGKIKTTILDKAKKELGIKPDKVNPLYS